MLIREYQSSDCKELVELFYNTVHTVNAKDYLFLEICLIPSDTQPRMAG